MLRAILIALFAFFFIGPASAQVHVQGYYRSNGTYVQPHERSAPDNSYNNNWSVKPNVNPYTGQQGTRNPTFNDQPPSQGLVVGSVGAFTGPTGRTTTASWAARSPGYIGRAVSALRTESWLCRVLRWNASSALELRQGAPNGYGFFGYRLPHLDISTRNAHFDRRL